MSETINDSTHFLKKYKDMVSLRNDFNTIDLDNFILPTMGEMVQEDLMSEILQNFMEDEEYKDKEKGILDESFYTEAPFTTALGYHPQEGVFVLNAKALGKQKEKNAWSFNKMDGDTTYYELKNIDDGGEPFTFTNRMTYSSFKDYYNKMNGSNALTIRHLGLDCPELPHIELQAVPGKKEDEKHWKEVTMTFKEVKQLAKTKTSVDYLKYPMNDDRTEIVERKDDDKVRLLQIIDNDGKIAYKEILNNNLLPGIEDDVKDYGYNEGYKYHIIVSKDDSKANTVIDGYKCQKLIRETLENSTDILLMINANGINFGRKSTTTQMTFNSLYYVDDTIDFMLEQWQKSFANVGETNYSYRPYGTDTYTRSLGVVYIKQVKNGETRWINVNKLILANSEHSTANPSYTSSPELQAIGAGVSDAFKTWSYDKNNLLYLDSFSSLTYNSYQEKLNLHKKLTGIDFTQTRNCSLMIGDTLMLIPPESIRNITQVFYEKIPNMRSKGTMAKQVGQNEQMLELTLYFYEDAGINGIKYDYTTPSGDKLTYYMNGLRSLLAQFKIAPFLPIENGYINDVLGIEAVSMQNIYIQTVEGFPRLLKVVLTLREFNYRTFMPDLPISDDQEDNESTLSELNPMFAKCFNWDIFRYYYQRSIMAGEELKNLPFASYDYNLQFYTHKNTLQPFDFCSPPGMGSNISLYIPDELWLKNALEVKKARDASLYTDTSYLDLSENAQEFLGHLNTLYQRLYSTIDNKKHKMYTAMNEIFQYGENVKMSVAPLSNIEEEYTSGSGLQKCIKNYNVSEPDSTTKPALFIINEKFNPISGRQIREKINVVKQCLLDEINDVSYMNSLTVNEVIFLNKFNYTYDLCWDFNIKLNTTSLTDSDMAQIKEVLIKNISSNDQDITIDKIFVNNIIKIRFVSHFNPTQPKEFPDEFKSLTTNFYTGDLISSVDKKGNDATMAFDQYAYDYVALQQISSIIETTDPETGEEEVDVNSNANNKAIDFYVKDYKNPANMPFVPFLENVPVAAIAANTSNTFTDISLKAVEGVGPQFLGGQDTTIEIEIITDDIMTVSMINNLPTMASAIAKQYRRVLPSWPLKIRSEFTGLISVSEVLIDAIEVGTMEGYPGVYTISMRLTSVDRTQRQREALRRLDIAPTGGNVNVGSSNLAINKYFAIESALSQAELYPDLDLPTLDDMAKLGWKFVKYTGDNRVYPDPDFYITYAYPYSSLIIKKAVKDVLSKQLLSEDGDINNQSFKFSDVMGMSVTAKVESLLGLSEVSCNDAAKTYDAILEANKESLAERIDALQLSEEKKQSVYNAIDELTILNHLLMCDVTDGWEIKSGFKAPICDESVNQAIIDMQLNSIPNAYAADIKQKRIDAIQLINKILSKPLDYVTFPASIETTLPNDYQVICEKAVNKIFWEDSDGKKLLQLLCPSIDFKKLNPKMPNYANQTGYHRFDPHFSTTFNEKYFNELNPLKYIAGYVFAAGCALSGSQQFVSGSQESTWHPSHYIHSEDISKLVYAKDEKYSKVYMPYIEYDRLAGRTNYAEEIETGVENGNVFGAWRIRQYSADEIDTMFLRDDRTIVYSTEYDDELYKKKKYSPPFKHIKDGFLDPYYNNLGANHEETKKYKLSIALSKQSNVEAFIRVALQQLKKMILDGLIFSEIDIMMDDFQTFYNQFAGTHVVPNMANATGQAPILSYSDASDALKVLNIDQKDMDELLIQMKFSFRQSLCARLIYPFLVATCENDPKVYELLMKRDTNALSGLIGYVQTSSQTYAANGKVYKFMSALSGCGLTASKNDSNESTASISQQLMNNMMKDVYIQASEDPRAYLLHSFYDMLVNDKRGRLVRAFPTYYFILIDEGRKIGSWKLHDNFYNMNAISEIQVVKSRKIAADTCTVTMSNTFNSYTTETDITTTQQYLDMYGLKDVFHSIFSPESYFEKEKALRLRQSVPETVQLQPGVRIHVRMGYSGDGSKLPIVFNGKIAEVEVGDVAQIVAQGDGHELMNPLNAFGELEANQLDPAQEMCTWFKDLRGSLSKGGETPRDLLAKLLTAKYGGWKKVANEAFDGRWFNDNPFGIMHFGDPKYNHIFDLGEPVQNLYEVSDTQLLKGTNQLWTDDNPKKSTPIINTSLQDKTLWDILHLCANSGLGYIGAIRDFGFRSTVFLGKPNHYYAYDYTLVDNKVVEKRKPFQQFHYYDSYNDIIYNSIKASEAQMKTNAVGLWQASSAWWGREQATVGPIYLDMNIYPEYQKSMTVDTGLLADGNGGVDFPFITHFSEKWAMNPNDDKVNKALAWRVTANALRDSVKDMYQGDIGIIGDPSVKPHDRVYMYDTYEDMQGMFEVEAVVHTMSVQTGFTTSILPDVIARHQDEMEAANQGLLNNVGATLYATVASNVAYNIWTAAVNNRLTVTLAKSKAMYGATSKLLEHSKNLANAAGMIEYLEKHPVAKQFFSSLNFIPTENNLNLNRFTMLIDAIAAWKPAGSINKDFTKFAEMFMKFNDLDMDTFTETIMNVYKSDKYGVASAYTEADIKKAIEEAQKTYKSLFAKLDKSLGKVDLTSFANDIHKLGIVSDITDPKTKEILNLLAKNTDIDTATKSKYLAQLLNDDVISKNLIGDAPKLKLNGIDDVFTDFKNLVLDKDTGLKAKAIVQALKGGDAIQDLLSVVVKVAKTTWASVFIDLAITLVTEVFIRNTKEMFTRWLQSVQAIDVYPIKRNGKPLVAGMNGHKGSVAMYPVNDGYNSIQGMILETVDAIDSLSVFGWKWGKTLRNMFVVDDNILSSLCNEWRNDLGLTDPDVENSSLDPIYNPDKEDFYQNAYNEVSSAFANKSSAAYLTSRNRITNFATANNKETYNYYAITGVSASNIITNSNVRKLHFIERDDVLQKAIANDKLVISHKKNYTTYANIQFESGNERIPVIVNNNIVDTPLVQEEIIYILKELVKNDSIKGKIHFKSGARFNDNSWKSTGFRCILEYQGSDDRLRQALDSLKIKTAIKDVEQSTKEKTVKKYLFAYEETKRNVAGATDSIFDFDNKYIITVYPPSQKISE